MIYRRNKANEKATSNFWRR